MPPEPISKTQRLLDLVAFLVGRRYPVTREQLYDAVPAYARERARGATEPESLRKKFLRDKSELAALGIDIETRTFGHESDESHGYLLAQRNFYLPYLKLLAGDRREGPAAAVPTASREVVEVDRASAAVAVEGLWSLAEHPEFPLRDAARSAWRKLTLDLLGGPDVGGGGVHLLSPEPHDVAPRVETLSAALRERRVCRFTYHGAYRPDTTERVVEPRGILHKSGRWYLIAWDRDRAAVRTFRVGRMEGLSCDEAKVPQYAIPDDFSLEAWVVAEAWNLPDDETPAGDVDVRFAFPRSLWADRNEMGELVADEGEGGQVRRFRVRQADAFLRWLLSLEGEATVVEPPELSEALRSLARSVAERYGASGAR